MQQKNSEIAAIDSENAVLRAALEANGINVDKLLEKNVK